MEQSNLEEGEVALFSSLMAKTELRTRIEKRNKKKLFILIILISKKRGYSIVERELNSLFFLVSEIFKIFIVRVLFIVWCFGVWC